MAGPGEGKRLRPVRRRDVLHRFLYTVEHPGPRGDLLDYTVEIDAGREDSRAALYVDGREQATADLPGSFPRSRRDDRGLRHASSPSPAEPVHRTAGDRDPGRQPRPGRSPGPRVPHHPGRPGRRALRDLHLSDRRVRPSDHRLGEILFHAAPTDLPPELAAAIREVDLSDADRSLIVVMSRVLEPALVNALADTLQALPTIAAASAFDDLPADADGPTCQDLAEHLLPLTLAIRARLPGLPDATTSSGAAAPAVRTIDEAVGDLYNPAQIDVLRRIRHLRRSLPHPNPGPELVRPDTPAASRSLRRMRARQPRVGSISPLAATSS
ncbi:MAG: hypothetical protein ACRDTC_18450 [Pseudonocardiaceae bacterium]